MKTIKYTVIIFAVLFAVIFAACSGGSDSIFNGIENYPVTEKISLTLPDGEKYLAITNLSPLYADLHFFDFSRAAVSANSQALARSYARSASLPDNKIIIKDSKSASRFNANPPLIPAGSTQRLVETASASDRYNVDTSYLQFWVENKYGNFIKHGARVRAKNDVCYIWVAEENYHPSSSVTGKYITSAQAQELADKFAVIYPRATDLLGYEYGGGPAGHGGIDGDKEIHILIYDINGMEGVPITTGQIAGYFHGKDEITQKNIDDYSINYPDLGYGGLKSNEMEIFYIDVSVYKQSPDTIYSTLVHEFQHMIHYNRKSLEQSLQSETWYNEMLSMAAEDVISPLIGILPSNPAHPINERIPAFLDIYSDIGIDEWLDGNNVIFSYATTYAFGAYLIRNFGGPELIQKMLSNNKANHDSVTLALKSTNSSLSFEKALEQYAEAIVYSTSHGGIPSGKASFDKTQEYTLNGIKYTAAAFDIWDTYNDPSLFKNPPRSKTKGPIIFDQLQNQPANVLTKYPLLQHSVVVHGISTASTGSWEFYVNRPSKVTIKAAILGYK